MYGMSSFPYDELIFFQRGRVETTKQFYMDHPTIDNPRAKMGIFMDQPWEFNWGFSNLEIITGISHNMYIAATSSI